MKKETKKLSVISFSGETKGKMSTIGLREVVKIKKSKKE